MDKVASHLADFRVGRPRVLIHKECLFKIRVISDCPDNVLHELAFFRPAVQFSIKSVICECIYSDFNRPTEELETPEQFETELVSVRVLRERSISLAEKYDIRRNGEPLELFPWKYTFAVKANVKHAYLWDLDTTHCHEGLHIDVPNDAGMGDPSRHGHGGHEAHPPHPGAPVIPLGEAHVQHQLPSMPQAHHPHHPQLQQAHGHPPHPHPPPPHAIPHLPQPPVPMIIGQQMYGMPPRNVEGNGQQSMSLSGQ